MDASLSRRLATLIVTASVAGLAACGSDISPTATEPSSSKPMFLVGDAVTPGVEPTVGRIVLCKTGNVDGTFTIVNTPANGGTPSVIASPVTVATGTCKVIVEDASLSGVGSFTTIDETSLGQVTAVARFANLGGPSDGAYTDASTQLFTNSYHGWRITYDNFVAPPPPPPALQGCSPGYWKNHSTWPTPYASSQLFSSVFENAFPGKTMQQVLSTGGGGLIALGRQTVSALLNAKALGAANYGMSAADVIAAFNTAYPGTSSSYTTLQNTFESMTDVNGRICPLN